MKRVLLTLFSYNRYELLKNAIASIDEFFPWGDRVVIDDGSTDPRIPEFLEEVSLKPQWNYHIQSHCNRDFGGFYANMNIALSYAKKGEYDYCFFFEDDEQFVWKKTDYLEYLDDVFSVCTDCIQVQPLLLRRIVNYGLNNEGTGPASEFIKEARVYRSEKGFSTSAIWDMAKVKREKGYKIIDSRPGSNLAPNSGYWLSKGYRLYYQFDPAVAIVPWVESLRGDSSGGKEKVLKKAHNEYILHPFGKAAVQFVKEHDPSVPPFQEYFNLSEANRKKPIWHQKNKSLDRYYFLCRKIFFTEKKYGSHPLGIPICPYTDTSRILPAKTHMERYKEYGKSLLSGNYLEDEYTINRNKSDDKENKKKLWRVPRALYYRSYWYLMRPVVDFIGYLYLKAQLKKEQSRLSHFS